MLRLGGKLFPLHLAMAFLIAAVSRTALFFGSMLVPVPNEAGLPISPLTANTALDLAYYQWAREMYFGEAHMIVDHFVRFFSGNLNGNFFLPGPLFPSVLHIFDYGDGNTLLLSAFYLLLSTALVAIWLWWFNRNGAAPIWLYLFALLPTPYWFMLNVSTDLLFAVVVGAFWLLWFHIKARSLRRMISVAAVIVVAALLRPNALSLLLFLCVDVLIWEFALKQGRQARRRGMFFAALVASIFILIGTLYAPYFHAVVSGSVAIGYFGYLPRQYLEGLWPDLPVALNLGFSWFGLVAAKLLYLTGLRPSFGDTALPFVILRMLPGAIVLPGLIWSLLRAEWRERLFVVFFLAPIFLGVAQDRYLLPIQPVLFYYGICAWREIVGYYRKFRIRTA